MKKRSKSEDELKALMEESYVYINSLKNTIDEMVAESFLTRKEGTKLSVKGREQLGDLSEEIKCSLQRFEEYEKTRKEGDFKSFCILWNKLIEKRKNIKSLKQLGSYDDIRLSRSYAMHKAANKMFETKGVWKIGDRHIEDIQNKILKDSSETISYNLEPRRVFEDEIDFDDEEFVEVPLADYNR